MLTQDGNRGKYGVYNFLRAILLMNARMHYVCLPPDQKFFWPEYENSCIFRASCHKDVLVFMLFYHRKKIPKLGCQSGEIEGGAQVGTLVGLLRLRYGR